MARGHLGFSPNGLVAPSASERIRAGTGKCIFHVKRPSHVAPLVERSRLPRVAVSECAQPTKKSETKTRANVGTDRACAMMLRFAFFDTGAATRLVTIEVSATSRRS